MVVHQDFTSRDTQFYCKVGLMVIAGKGNSQRYLDPNESQLTQTSVPQNGILQLPACSLECPHPRCTGGKILWVCGWAVESAF